MRRSRTPDACGPAGPVRRRARAAAGGALLALAGCGTSDRRGHEGGFNLPATLNEVSGLAAAGPDSVFAHEDQHAIIYELRLVDGQPVRAFALGDPTIEGDFEGIATVRGIVYLVTSDGLVYAARPGRDGARVPFAVHDSGVGVHCEIEGLTQAPGADALLLLCKRFRDGRPTGAALEIYRWPIGAGRADPRPWLSLPLQGVLGNKERAKFRPSALEWDAARQRLLVASAGGRLLMALDRTGAVLALHRLKSGRHAKTEGMAIMADGRLVLADEGATTHEARLTAYADADSLLQATRAATD
jgi:hypothetical protein